MAVVSTNSQESEHKPPPAQSKPATSVSIQRALKEQEIENIKRQLSHLIDRVEGLKTKPA